MSRGTYEERYKPVQELREPIYERQPHESRAAYEAFTHYRDSLEERTLRRTARELHKSLTQMGGWNRVWRWQERVDAWDGQLDLERRQAARKAVREMGERHAKAAVAAMGLALRGMQAIDPAEMRAGEIARLLDVAVKTERIARGEPTEITEHAGVVRTRVLTDAELDAFEGAPGPGPAEPDEEAA
jgi:hypothetical protein